MVEKWRSEKEPPCSRPCQRIVPSNSIRVLDEAVETLYKKKEGEDMRQHQGTVITIATNKGGAGKTTSTAAIADILARREHRVLLIDADPQGNLSKRFGFAPNAFAEN